MAQPTKTIFIDDIVGGAVSDDGREFTLVVSGGEDRLGRIAFPIGALGKLSDLTENLKSVMRLRTQEARKLR